MANAMTILVVEDEEIIAGLVRKLLHRRGDNVLIARTAAEAWDRLERNQGKVQRALIDLTLPDIDGLTLATQIHARYPEIGIVLTTGGTDPLVSEFGILLKPFDAQELWAKLA
jgi:CheY-like chemotaxis protein